MKDGLSFCPSFKLFFFILSLSYISILQLSDQLLEKADNLSSFISSANPAFENLSTVDKELAKVLVADGNTNLVKDLSRLIYDYEPLPIEDFLTNKIVGHTATSLFPRWRAELIGRVFAPGSKVNEIILSGSTGGGKTHVALLCLFYNTYKILAFKEPQLMFGVAPSATLASLMISIDLDKAQKALLRPYVALLKASNIFVEVKKEGDLADRSYFQSNKIPFLDRGGIYFPKNNLTFCGSNEGHTISMNLVSALLDEAEFRRSANAQEEAMSLYLTIKERLENRFMDCDNRLLALVSSAKSSEGVIPKYIEDIGDSEKTIVFSFAVWDVRSFDAYDKGHFWVLKGNRMIPSRMLSKVECAKHEKGEFNLPKNCKMIKVPELHRDAFTRDVDRALRNTAGEVSISDLFVFSSYYPWENYSRNLCPEVYLTADYEMEDVRLIDQLPSELFVSYGSEKLLKRAPNVERYAHLDLAEVGEAGVAICHKELGEDNTVLYVLDLVAKVTSPTRIDLESIMNLFIDLKEQVGVTFKVISADQYQSSYILQQFKKKLVAFEVKRLSVDRTMEPYYSVSSLVSKAAIVVGHSPTLHEQVKDLRENQAGKQYYTKRKDLSDAFCGAVFNALSDTRSLPTVSFCFEEGIKKSEVDMSKFEELN